MISGSKRPPNAASTRTGAPGALAGLAEVADRLPRGAIVSVETDDAWVQLWAVYYMRDVRVSVPHPSEYLVGLGRLGSTGPLACSRARAGVCGAPEGRPALWAGYGLDLERGCMSVAARRRARSPRSWAKG